MRLLVCRDRAPRAYPDHGVTVERASLFSVADVSGDLFRLETMIELFPQDWPHRRIVRALRLLRHEQPWLEESK